MNSELSLQELMPESYWRIKETVTGNDFNQVCNLHLIGILKYGRFSLII